MKKILLLAVAMLFAISGYSQTIVNDPQKRKLWSSMEHGKWDFAPDWYYLLFHKNYSGAEAYWQWAGFDSGIRVRFKVEKSNVKQIGPVRVTSAATQTIKKKSAIKERDYIYEPFKEDVANQADRLVDVTYSSYEDEFNRMQNVIEEGLLICMNKSKGQLKRQVDDINRQNAIICENISYIHKSGPEGQLSNSKRQKAYEEAKKEMSKLVRKTTKLTQIAMCVY